MLPIPSLVAPRSGRDHTQAMRAYARGRLAAPDLAELDGYVVKKGSPSCGLERVRVYDDHGVPSSRGRGLFAEALLAARPGLPIEEDGRLNDDALRDGFLLRVHAHHRLRVLFGGAWNLGQLVQGHAREKLLLLAHSPAILGELGRLVARGRARPSRELAREYRELFLAALARAPDVGRHVNVLQHLAGYFKHQTSADERRELVETIADYRAGRAPRAVPLTLLRHYARRNGQRYLLGQTYLEPYPPDPLPSPSAALSPADGDDERRERQKGGPLPGRTRRC